MRIGVKQTTILLDLSSPHASGVLTCAIADFDPIVFAQFLPLCLISPDLNPAAIIEHSHFHDPLFVL